MTFDLTPLYSSTIGFDHLNRIFDGVQREKASYPPYNIVRLDDDKYRITLAIAGFSSDDIDVTTERNTLTVTGKKENEDDADYLHKGIAFRNFERRFQLADYVVVNGADINNGLLYIDLERQLPEVMKPRKITIGGNASKAIEGEKAEVVS